MLSINTSFSHPRQRSVTAGCSDGFTLIELMIVVAVVAILAAIALPAYQKQIMQSRRTSAKTALFDVTSREEKLYSVTNQYSSTLTDLGYTATTTLSVPSSSAAYYSVQVNLTGTTTPGTNYTAVAKPINSQSGDACGSYSVTDLGVESNSGGSQTTGCW